LLFIFLIPLIYCLIWVYCTFLVITLIIIITTVIEMFAADISVSGLRCTWDVYLQAKFDTDVTKLWVMCVTVVHTMCQLYFYIIVQHQQTYRKATWQWGMLIGTLFCKHITEDGHILCSYDISNSLFYQNDY
jgi:hypothetical protein